MQLPAVGRAEREEYLALLEERLRREARDDLNAYCRYIEIPGAPISDDDECEEFYPDNVIPAAHHELINDAWMQIDAGTCRRVMLFMPPGSAKSTYGSVTGPTWYMGRNPGKNVICTSYASELAKRFGRKCRQITRSPQFRHLFDAELVADNRAADDWSLTNAATYMSAGILAGVTGNRADVLVIDDPVRGHADAESPTIREKIWQAYLNDLRTRLKPRGAILIVQTRWHEDDLSGRILPKDWNGESGKVIAQDGEEWLVICLPAQCERDDDPLGRKPGEWLWTDWFSPEHWEQEKRTQGSRNWSALFQQKPRPEDGGIFKAPWFTERHHGIDPAHGMVVLSLDTAYKPDQINDPSACSVWYITRTRYYLLHVWRERVDYPTLRNRVIALDARWNPDAVLIEDKASGQSLIQELKATTKIPVIAIEPEGDKKSRANAVSSQCEAGLVVLPHAAPWLFDFEQELFGFPLSTHDDQVDTLTQFLKWAHRHAKNITYASLGQKNAGTSGFDDTGDSQGSQIDESTGFGRVRGRSNLDGY